MPQPFWRHLKRRFDALPCLAQGALMLAAALLCTFGDALCSNSEVLSQPGTDLDAFAYWRWLGFGALRHGILPQWNPKLFSGMPFLANFQTALFYPVNFVHLVLPPVCALNWEMVINLFVAGLGVFAWSRRRGCSLAAATLSGLLLMFGMPWFLRLFAGHLAPLAAMSWMPWIFCEVDALLLRPAAVPLLRGMLFCGLQLLAGHPQTSFNTAVAVALYAGFDALASRRSLRAMLARAGALAALPLGGLALAAIQILPGALMISSTVRAHVTYSFAATFSLAPENLLTLITPFFFGDVNGSPYWGRWYLWEMSLSMGITGLLLAGYGLAAPSRRRLAFGATIAALLLLALGYHTPLLRLLYNWVPVFDRLRGQSKFVIPLSLLLATLAATGYDRWRLRYAPHGSERDKPRLPAPLRCWPPGAVAVYAACAVLPLLAALFVLYDGALWRTFVDFVLSSGESYIAPGAVGPAFYADTAACAARALVAAAAVPAILAVLLVAIKRRRCGFGAIALLAVAEVWLAAVHMRPSFGAAELQPSPEKVALAHGAYSDDRVLDTSGSNQWQLLSIGSAWGYDPFVLKRTVEFMALTQGADPASADYTLPITRYSPLLALLRCRYVYTQQQGRRDVGLLPPPLPHVLLVGSYRLAANRAQTFALLTSPAFDARREVVLEKAPTIAPRAVPAGGAGTVRITAQTMNSLDIEADLKAPQLLLVTDPYCPGWSAEPLAGSSQQHYEVLAADHMLRAIALGAGVHHLRLAYHMPGLATGAAISGVALLLLLVGLGLCRREGAGTQLACGAPVARDEVY